MTYRVKGAPGMWNLYWVETQDHSEDWFIVAKNRRQAERIHEGEEGYDRGDATAKKVVQVPREFWDMITPGWPSDELIEKCGGEFVYRLPDKYEAVRRQVGGGRRVVVFGDKVYREGDIVRTVLMSS